MTYALFCSFMYINKKGVCRGELKSAFIKTDVTAHLARYLEGSVST